MEIDDLLPIAAPPQMWHFAVVAGGDTDRTAEGRQFAETDIDTRKRLFARHLLTYVALVAHIRRVLDERPGHRAPWSRFADELEDHISPGVAEQTLRAVIDLGRHAEILACEDRTHVFSLDNP